LWYVTLHLWENIFGRLEGMLFLNSHGRIGSKMRNCLLILVVKKSDYCSRRDIDGQTERFNKPFAGIFYCLFF